MIGTLSKIPYGRPEEPSGHLQNLRNLQKP